MGLSVPGGALGRWGRPPPTAPPRLRSRTASTALDPRPRKHSCPTGGRSTPLGGPRLDGINSLRPGSSQQHQLLSPFIPTLPAPTPRGRALQGPPVRHIYFKGMWHGVLIKAISPFL